MKLSITDSNELFFLSSHTIIHEWFMNIHDNHGAVILGACTIKSVQIVRHFADAIFKCIFLNTWWRHQMETFSALLAFNAGNSPVTGEFPSQRPETRNFDVFYDLLLNKRLSKQPWGWWYETPSCSLWRHCNEKCLYFINISRNSFLMS